MLNIGMLSTLVTWAAQDYLLRSNPERAASLGIAPDKNATPGEWDQGTWGRAERNGHCKTAFCIAGGAVALDRNYITVMRLHGVLRNGTKDYEQIGVVKADQPLPDGVEAKDGYIWLDDSPEESESLEGVPIYGTSDTGQHLLGLTEDQRSYLFDGDNSIEAVVSLAYTFAKEAGMVLDVPPWVLEDYYDEDWAQAYIDR